MCIRDSNRELEILQGQVDEQKKQFDKLQASNDLRRIEDLTKEHKKVIALYRSTGEQVISDEMFKVKSHELELLSRKHQKELHPYLLIEVARLLGTVVGHKTESEFLCYAEANAEPTDFEFLADLSAAKGFMIGNRTDLQVDKQLEDIHTHFRGSLDSAKKIADPSKKVKSTLSIYRLYFQSLAYRSSDAAREVMSDFIEFQRSQEYSDIQIVEDIRTVLIHMLRELGPSEKDVLETEQMMLNLIPNEDLRRIVSRQLIDARQQSESLPQR